MSDPSAGFAAKLRRLAGRPKSRKHLGRRIDAGEVASWLARTMSRRVGAVLAAVLLVGAALALSMPAGASPPSGSSHGERPAVGTDASAASLSIDDEFSGGAWGNFEEAPADAYGTVSVTGSDGSDPAGDPTGMVTFNFYAAAGCSSDLLTSQQINLSSGSATSPSTGIGSLATPGTYSAEVVYVGDSNYAPTTSGCEQFAVAAPDAFSCTVATAFLGQGGPTQLYTEAYGAGKTTFDALGEAGGGDPSGNPSAQYSWTSNAWGYDTENDLLYAVSSDNLLLQVDSQGIVSVAGVIATASAGADGTVYTPVGGGDYEGAFDNAGTADAGDLFIAPGNDYPLYAVDVTPVMSGGTAYVVATPISVAGSTSVGGDGDFADFAFNDGSLYSLSYDGDDIQQVTDITMPPAGSPPGTAGTATEQLIDVSDLGFVDDGNDYGAAWTYGNGDLGFEGNGLGNVYEVAVDNDSSPPTFSIVSHELAENSQGTVFSTSNNDGAACPGQSADLSIAKTGPATVDVGGTISWNLTVTDNGPGDSSGYAVDDNVPPAVTGVATTTEGCSVGSPTDTGTEVSCVEGELPVGDDFTITITGTAPDTTQQIVNEATVTGNDATKSGCTPTSQDPPPCNQSSTATTEVVNDSVATMVVDSASGSAWTGEETLGASAYDTTTVTDSNDVIPTGSVTYSLFDNGTCTTPSATTDEVTIDDGAVPRSAIAGPLSAGSYSFQASYTGGGELGPNTSPCEPFGVGQATIGISTSVYDATSGAPWSGVEATGADAYDMTTATGEVDGFTPGGSVTYEVYGNSGCAGTALGTETADLGRGGTFPHSDVAGLLAPGSYAFAASYSGDANYNQADGACEPFTVAKAATATTTQVFDHGTGVGWSGTETTGATAYDTAAVQVPTVEAAHCPCFTGVGGGSFTPTGSVTYGFYDNGTCVGEAGKTSSVELSGDASVPDSGATQRLSAGTYGFEASYSGDDNYARSVGACESFAVNPTALVTLTKSVVTTRPDVGSDDTFTLVAKNAGPDSAGKVVVTDVLATGLSYVSSQPSAGVVTDSGQTVTWTVADLGAPGDGGAATLSLVVKVGTTSRVANTATFTAATPSPSGATSGSSNAVDLTPAYAEITLTKTATVADPVAGTRDTYLVTVYDAGPDAAPDVVVTDPLPSGLSLVSAIASTGNVAVTESASVTTVTWRVAKLADVASATMRVVTVVSVAGGSVVNTATATDALFDPAGQRRTASATVNVIPVVVVPGTHTGEPWSGWLYWLLVVMFAGAGALILIGRRRRRRLMYMADPR